MEINGGTNSISFFDDERKLAVNLDEDAAVDEGFTELFIEGLPDENGNYKWVSKRFVNGQWRYKYPLKGPGIAVGYNINHSAGFSAVGRKKLLAVLLSLITK